MSDSLRSEARYWRQQFTLPVAQDVKQGGHKEETSRCDCGVDKYEHRNGKQVNNGASEKTTAVGGGKSEMTVLFLDFGGIRVKAIQKRERKCRPHLTIACRSFFKDGRIVLLNSLKRENALRCSSDGRI